MKKFVNKGLVKIENQTAKSIQYHLTPKGMAALADKTLRYIKASYNTVREMTDRIIEIGRRYAEDGYTIYVVGSKDEMMELCLLALNDGKLDYHIGAPDAGADKALILCWEQDVEDDFTCVNLLKLKG